MTIYIPLWLIAFVKVICVGVVVFFAGMGALFVWAFRDFRVR